LIALGWIVQERGNGSFLIYRPGPGGAAGALAAVASMQKNVRAQTCPEIAQRIQAQRSQLIPLQVDIGDARFDAQTDLGQRSEVPSGSNYYWRAGSGNEIIGTETSSRDLPLH
jgi:hypothetical protein